MSYGTIGGVSAVSALVPLQRSRVTSSVSSPAAAIGSAFLTQQASLIVNRTSTLARAKVYQGTLSRVVNFERSARELLSLSNLNSPFASREVNSGDTSVVTGSADELSASQTFGISVYQLAKAQSTRSDDLGVATAHGLGSGTETFRLTRDGTDFDMSVDLSAVTNNEDVLNAVATAINDTADIGVSATVTTNASTGKGYITLTSTATGADSAFTLSDQSGTLLADIGLETGVTADVDNGTGGTLVNAQDAQYALDGGATTTSSSNTIDLFDDSVELTLASTSTTPVTVQVRPNTSEISEEIQSFLSSRDNLFDYLAYNAGQGTTPLAYELQSHAQRLSLDLYDMGVSVDTDGTFTIDEDKLKTAIQDNFSSVFSTMTGPQGLAVQGRRVARAFLDASSKAITNPPNEVAASAMMDHQDNYTMGMLVNLIG